MSESFDVVIVGAGLAGSLAALLLSKRNFSVLLAEREADPRGSSETTTDGEYGNSRNSIKRSINLALSHRGEEALRHAGILKDVLQTTVEMKQRVITTYFSYHFFYFPPR